MKDTFDPYLKWLGIPPERQPPDHYTLLGVALFTSDSDVIENAADRQMAHVHKFQSGSNEKEAAKLLSHLSAAKLLLLNPETKAAYDETLAIIGTKQGGSSPPPPPVSPADELDDDGRQLSMTNSILTVFTSRIMRPSSTTHWLAITCVGIVLLTTAWAIFFSDDSVPVTATTNADSPAVPQPPPIRSVNTEAVDESLADHEVEVAIAEDARPNAEASEVKPQVSAPQVVADINDDRSDKPKVESPPKKAPSPTKAELDLAAAEVGKVFGKDFASAKSADEKLAIAMQMVKVGIETKELPIRFALYQQAMNIAKGAGNAQVAFQAIEHLDQAFEIDALRLKASALHQVSEQLRQRKEQEALAEPFNAVIAQALAQDRFDIAKPLCEIALSSATKSGNFELRKLAVLRTKEVEELAKAFEDVSKALAVLKSSPTDASANLAVGKYYILQQGEWAKGLSFLALGNDERLKKLAELEMSKPVDHLALADGWWDLAEGLEGKPWIIWR